MRRRRRESTPKAVFTKQSPAAVRSAAVLPAATPTVREPQGSAKGAPPPRAPGAQAPSPLLRNSIVIPGTRGLLKWMFSFLRPVKWLCVLACIYLALGISTEVLTTRQMGEAVNHIKALHASQVETRYHFFAWFFGPTGEAIELRGVIGWLSVVVGAFLVLRYIREVANAKLSMTMVYYIREAVYDKLQRVGFGFHDAISTGQLINRALTDLQNVRSFIQTAVLVTLEIVLIVGGYEILLATRSAWVAALALVPLPLWTWYILRFSRKVQPAARAVMEAEDRNVTIITENIAGVHVIKAFATEKQEIGKYYGHCDEYLRRVLHRIRLFANFQPVISGIATASHLSLFLLAAILIIKHRLEIGDFLILGSAMGAILGRLQQVSVINDQYQNAVVSARRLYEVLAAPPTVPEKPDAKPLPPGLGCVKFDHVTFGYDPAKPVLKDVSFEVPGGSVVAIVGPTGAGKTTLVNLIARFYDAQGGRVLIDGVDVRDLRLDSLRPNVAFVFQETYLFSDTVAANIAYGRPHVRNRDGTGPVEAAARLAQAHEFIEKLSRGYDSMLGERGSSLSGGQRQRLAIARAIFADPRILVLDDATAAVDPETEDQIRRGMNFVMKGRTTFLIAHRISTVKRADIVIVVEEGRITQTGTHAQLMREEGHYAEIAAAQLYGDEEMEVKSEHPSHMRRVQDPKQLAAATAAAQDQSREQGEDV